MTAQTSRKRRVRMMRAAVAVGTALICGALVAWQSGQSKSATSPNPAPPPCVVGTPACRPLPTLPTGHTPMPPDAHLRGRPWFGLLRPGTYDSLGLNGLGFHLVFTVPTGWMWDGEALSKGNAAIYFSTSPGPVVVYKDPCHWDGPRHAYPPVPWEPTSPTDIAAALAAQPMRYPTHPTVIPSSIAFATARGSDAVEIRLTVPSNLAFSTCDRGYYTTWQTAHTIRSQQAPGQRDLIAMADVDGRRVIIDASTFPNTPIRLVHQEDAILASVKAGGWG